MRRKDGTKEKYRRAESEKMFTGALLVHLVNFAMWTLAGVMFGAEKAHAATVETPPQVKTETPISVSYRGVIPTVSQGTGVSISKHADSENVSKSKRQSKRIAGGADTGTTGDSAHRYGLVKQAVKDGLKPSVRAIQAKFGGSPGVLIGYLKQLETEGLTVRDGRGWKAVKHA